MVVFLDYIRSPVLEDILFLSLIDDDGSQHDFYTENLDSVEEFLTQEILIITYERPFRHLVPHIDEENLIEHEVRKYYVDLFRKLQEQTGYKISLSGLARGMLGTGPQSFISKLPMKEVYVPDLDVQTKVHERLRAIRDIYEAMISTGFVSFYFKHSLHSQEVDTDELT